VTTVTSLQVGIGPDCEGSTAKRAPEREGTPKASRRVGKASEVIKYDECAHCCQVDAKRAGMNRFDEFRCGNRAGNAKRTSNRGERRNPALAVAVRAPVSCYMRGNVTR
jgi:hypothetical protein